MLFEYSGITTLPGTIAVLCPGTWRTDVLSQIHKADLYYIPFSHKITYWNGTGLYCSCLGSVCNLFYQVMQPFL